MARSAVRHQVKPGPTLLAVVLALVAAPLAAQTPGRLVIIGGGLSRDNEVVYRAVLDARHGDGPLCVIPTAGALPDSGMAGPVANFERWGGAGSAKGILISSLRPETAHDPAVVAQIRTCSGFYFIGGVQSRIVRAFRPNGQTTPAYDAVLQRWREGAVVSGSSAGAAIMSDPMIAGGNSAGAIARGVQRAGSAATGIAADEDDSSGAVSLTAGLGFFPRTLVDQHFLARGRVGRLTVAILALDDVDLGFGIDENTALVVTGDTVYSVGASAVVVLDERDVVRNGPSASGIRLHLMSTGDRFVLSNRRLTLAAGKTPLGVTDTPVAAPEDMFARWSFLHLIHALGGASARELSVPIEGGHVVLTKTADFQARALATPGVQNTPSGLSVTGLMLELRR